MFTNKYNLPPHLVSFLVNSHYANYKPKRNQLNVSKMSSPIRSLLLYQKAVVTDSVVYQEQDVMDLFNRTIGNVLHKELEYGIHNIRTNLKKVKGYSDKYIESLVVNPQGYIPEGNIPIYTEQRGTYQLNNGFTLKGRFDVCWGSSPRDLKSISYYKYGDIDAVRIQLSLYRLMFPDVFTSDVGYVDYVIRDFKQPSKPEDPISPVCTQEIKLIPVDKLKAVLDNITANLAIAEKIPDDKIPECTDSQLWRKPSEYKYFSNESNPRCTKNFKQDKEGAEKHLKAKGKGVIKVVEYKAKRCNYCDAAPYCSQYLRLKQEGNVECQE